MRPRAERVGALVSRALVSRALVSRAAVARAVLRRAMLTGAVLTGSLLSSAPVDAQSPAESSDAPPANLGEALRRGDASVSLRYRFELVDDDAFDDRAEASTLRTVLGYRSAPLDGWSIYFEAEDVSVLGDDEGFRNAGAGSLDNGVRDLPVVADPEITEIQQVYLRKALAFDGGSLEITAGRQEIVLGDQRFLGPVGWRQNHQAFDALRVEGEGERWSLDASYLDRVHRIFGDDRSVSGQALRVPFRLCCDESSTESGESASAWTVHAVPFGLWLDFDSGSGSSDTIGFEVSADRRWNQWSLDGTARWARQQADAGVAGDPGATRHLWFAVAGDRPVGAAESGSKLGFRIAWERLGAGEDGGPAFGTPLATLHKWNGWADQFLATPLVGLDTTYLTIRGTWRSRVNVSLVYLDFQSDEGDIDFGSEIDAVVAVPTPWGPTASLKIADFSADDLSKRDVRKAILTLAYRF